MIASSLWYNMDRYWFANAVSHSTLGIASAFATPQDPKSNSNLYLSVWAETRKGTEKGSNLFNSIISIFYQK